MRPRLSGNKCHATLQLQSRLGYPSSSTHASQALGPPRPFAPKSSGSGLAALAQVFPWRREGGIYRRVLIECVYVRTRQTVPSQFCILYSVPKNILLSPVHNTPRYTGRPIECQTVTLPAPASAVMFCLIGLMNNATSFLHWHCVNCLSHAFGPGGGILWVKLTRQRGYGRSHPQSVSVEGAGGPHLVSHLQHMRGQQVETGS